MGERIRLKRIDCDLNEICWHGDAIRSSRRRHRDVALGDVVLLVDGQNQFMGTATQIKDKKIYFLVDWEWA